MKIYWTAVKYFPTKLVIIDSGSPNHSHLTKYDQTAQHSPALRPVQGSSARNRATPSRQSTTFEEFWTGIVCGPHTRVWTPHACVGCPARPVTTASHAVWNIDQIRLTFSIILSFSDVENSNFLKIKKQRNTQRVLCFHILEKEKIQILLWIFFQRSREFQKLL